MMWMGGWAKSAIRVDADAGDGCPQHSTVGHSGVPVHRTVEIDVDAH